MRYAIHIIVSFLLLLNGGQRGLAAEPASWPAKVPGFVPPKPGEHPRLLFRKADLPELRQRAQTPEGRAIVARLKRMLGGGDAMPTLYNPSKQSSNREPEAMPLGTYSMWHAAGFGMLYQLNGDQKHADLARECVEKALAGQRDWDDRYAWVNPGSSMRMAATASAIAIAYDLSYDGWDEAFRQRVAASLLNDRRRFGLTELTMERIARDPGFKPTHNHFGTMVGGAGLVMLAIKGDPGVDSAIVERCLESIHRNLRLGLMEGFGDHGYFFEHPAPSGVGALPALLPMLQAMNVSAGLDYISPEPNVPWITMRWAMWLVPQDGRPQYPNPNPTDSYGREPFIRAGMITRGGHFSQGFGAIMADQKPALLWVYNHFIEPSENKEYPMWLNEAEKSYDALDYPHRAVLALINWPIGIKETNPSQLLPKAVEDKVHGYYFFRNRWKDSDDIVVSALLGARPDTRSVPVSAWGLGERRAIGAFPKCVATHVRLSPDGSGIVSGGGKSLAVDFSGASGADALVVMTGDSAAIGKNSSKMTITSVKLGQTQVQILTIQSGNAPRVQVGDNQIVVGRQTITLDGGNLSLGLFNTSP